MAIERGSFVDEGMFVTQDNPTCGPQIAMCAQKQVPSKPSPRVRSDGLGFGQLKNPRLGLWGAGDKYALALSADQIDRL